MPKTDAYETELLSAFEGGALKSVATKAELAKFKAAASDTSITDHKVDVQLSSVDLQGNHETQYLLSMHGMRESIMEGIAEPIDDCYKDLDW